MNQPIRPCAFVCHGSEDHALAQRIAESLQHNGIETFFDGWEIQPGDSIRTKIDEGLARCTHFVVLLTPRSVSKSWVNAEIDAGFVRKVENACRFIPLRAGLKIDELTPLLRSLRSPSIDNFQKDISSLISSIHGITTKPEIGPAPAIVRASIGSETGLSPAAEAIAKLMIERSAHGDALDPSLEPDDLRKATGLLDDDLTDAVDELEDKKLVKRHRAIGEGLLGFVYITPASSLFVELDKYFTDRDPKLDALRVAADLINGANDGAVKDIAVKYGWTPRRMNPAINYLIGNKLVRTGREVGSHPWARHWVADTPQTRRFVRDHS